MYAWQTSSAMLRPSALVDGLTETTLQTTTEKCKSCCFLGGDGFIELILKEHWDSSNLVLEEGEGNHNLNLGIDVNGLEERGEAIVVVEDNLVDGYISTIDVIFIFSLHVSGWDNFFCWNIKILCSLKFWTFECLIGDALRKVMIMRQSKCLQTSRESWKMKSRNWYVNTQGSPRNLIGWSAVQEI